MQIRLRRKMGNELSENEEESIKKEKRKKVEKEGKSDP